MAENLDRMRFFFFLLCCKASPDEFGDESELFGGDNESPESMDILLNESFIVDVEVIPASNSNSSKRKLFFLVMALSWFKLVSRTDVVVDDILCEIELNDFPLPICKLILEFLLVNCD